MPLRTLSRGGQRRTFRQAGQRARPPLSRHADVQLRTESAVPNGGDVRAGNREPLSRYVTLLKRDEKTDRRLCADR